MTVSVNEIISQTLARLGESEPLLDDAVEFGSPELDVRMAIRMRIPFVAEEVIREADPGRIRECLSLPAAVERRGGISVVSLPSNFLRLLYIRMSDWESGVTRFIDADSDVASLHRLWSSRGRRHRSRPCVAIGRRGRASGEEDGSYELEIFGSGSGAEIAASGWLPVPTLSGDNLIFPPSLMAPLIDKLALLSSLV